MARKAPGNDLDRLFAGLPPVYAGVARTLRSVIRAEAPALTETIKWNNPFWVGREDVLCLQCYADHVNLGVLQGAKLADQFPELEGTGKEMRHVKVPSPQVARSGNVRRLVRAAVALDALSP